MERICGMKPRRRRGNSTLVLSALAVAFLVFCPLAASSKVKGNCANCHTMHNSQDNQPAEDRADVAFDRNDTNYTVVNLLVNACVGCHSSTGSGTIIDMGGGDKIPIVYNFTAPTSPLAGGNFYWVETLGDEYGHNVRTVDSILSEAPGGETSFGTVPNNCGFGGCHASLASIRYSAAPGTIDGNGCIGCHDPAHHADDEQAVLAGGYKFVTSTGGGYRFLNHAGGNFVSIPPHTCQPAVAGIESPNWQQSPSPTSHNEYQDFPKPGAPCAYGAGPSPPSPLAQGISDFCGGCHNSYHSWPAGGSPNGGGGSAWLRHPAGVVLPASGEYANYTNYDPNVPVARADASVLSGYGGPSQTVTPGEDKVMCLSCHRAHGSPYKDMLRWDYTSMIAGGGSNSTGCFVCHNTKDEP